jgi:hypothetical protein
VAYKQPEAALIYFQRLHTVKDKFAVNSLCLAIHALFAIDRDPLASVLNQRTHTGLLGHRAACAAELV